MIKHNQDGTVGIVGLGLFVVVLLLIGAVVFGAWAYSGKQDYKNNTDQKIAAAVVVTKQQEDTAQDNLFAQAAKLPLATYNGPETYGSIVVQYPKTWSGYVDDSGSGNNNAAFAAYFNPGVVPSISDQSSIFALQVQVLNQTYSDVLNSLTQNNSNNSAPLTSVAYALPKVPKAVGVETTGPLPDGQTGTMVVLPLRTQTIEIWTDGTQYLSDFNNNILPNFSFSP